MFSEEDQEPALNAEWLSNLAMHVLPETAKFLEWRDGLFSRLLALYTKPADEDEFSDLFAEDTGGPLVAPEIVDLERDYSVDMSAMLIGRFLDGVDFQKNPFVYSPQQMIEDGFEGVPYRL